jgi:hypothetical protein
MICYELSDTEGLETIELRLQIHLREEFSPAQTPALRRYRDHLEMRLDDVLDSLEEARIHPAWEFSLKRKTKAFLKSMQRELEEAILEASLRLKALRNLFNRAKRSMPVRKTRSAKKKPAPKKKPPAKKSAPMQTARGSSPAEPTSVQEEFPF